MGNGGNSGKTDTRGGDAWVRETADIEAIRDERVGGFGFDRRDMPARGWS